MLEKIGLPAKPSMRGGSWVVDASHCQGCSSQFTFINRKHHCRRCGGLFCNSCTQQRMVLRGQGDSPVRICNPCKDLEDAARFERYGHKNRSTKGASKQIQKQEEDILNQILGTDGKPESHAELISDLHRNASSASSSSNLNDESSSIAREGDFVDTGSSTPEELRLQAVEEKKKYRILKGAGKPEEALQAFKRGKELERQAGALEIALRKNRKMASKASNHQRDEPEESNSKRKLSYQTGKEEKNDLASELRELGWSDADLHDAEKKTVKLTLEGELSTLIKEIPQKSSIRKKTGSIEKSEVIALKRKALQLKREGKLAEAKEELKKAKILEKQLEEQELLGESEDSDDELSALIRSMDDDKHDDLLLDDAPIPPIPDINFEHFLGAGDNFQFDDDFEVTDNDMNDPHLVAALKSFGWTGEDDEEDTNALDREALQCEVLTLKREALAQKREGNVSEAMSLLKKAKLLEKDLENIQPDVQNFVPESLPKRSISQVSNEVNVPKLPAKSKIAIQRELLALKKKALALRREGRIEEADEELRKGKALEQQLEEAEKALKKPAPKVGINNLEINSIIEEEGVEAEVTDQDMHDPTLMSVLKNLGWNEDDAESVKGTNIKTQDMPSVIPQKSKVEIQRELLALKRKALSLRRQGKTEEAEEELERAKDLEKQLADIEASSSSKSIVAESKNLDPLISEVKSDAAEVDSPPKDQKVDSKGPAPQFDNISPILQPRVESVKTEDSHEDKVSPPTAPILQPTYQIKPEENAAEGIDAQKELILSHKKKAVALKREGKLSEAREELRKAKVLEKSLEPESHQAIVGSGVASAASSESTSKNSAGSGVASVSISESTSVSNASKTNLQQAQKPLTSSERFKLQRETLSHKRNALKLRREGKIEASEAELELAKALENQLEESNPQASSTSASEGLDDVGVEGLLDPQIMSALKSIGWGDNDLGVGPPKVSDPKPIADKSGDTQTKKTHLEEMIKSEKARALNLKREGKQAEAMEALRSAKQFEKKLASLN